ncbi:TetR/AcrR family transcriptional regulator [Apilactobacillus xinyiensis]|uniref:TetR/AcrR family transcriptional regulator n=1 Tax=Apilactobacillus xinyiensis TaxID=2841032 RepID=UPI001C7D1A55|nr:TetR/AcrR family transcriptional regulator [Apilactobacillus xinyiensis]
MYKKNIDRNKIIDVAENLVENLDTSEITIYQISKELGVTHSAIYKHFNNKKDLWESVSKRWFHKNIIDKIFITNDSDDRLDILHDILWSFVDLKRHAYTNNNKIFTLNTKYVENNPYILREILTSLYKKINKVMSWNDDYIKAETLLSAFTIFTFPSFKETWDSPEFEKRFENMWILVKNGIS